jgi:hypothetical protein
MGLFFRWRCEQGKPVYDRLRDRTGWHTKASQSRQHCGGNRSHGDFCFRFEPVCLWQDLCLRIEQVLEQPLSVQLERDDWGAFFFDEVSLCSGNRAHQSGGRRVARLCLRGGRAGHLGLQHTAGNLATGPWIAVCRSAQPGGFGCRDNGRDGDTLAGNEISASLRGGRHRRSVISSQLVKNRLHSLTPFPG